ncbi:hypothetical protein [Nocardioides limicola]|uniref:hypothetical protein n=1 Tax=Nocardioides limicola TaxID=2803368 RepID=UPI001EF05130|nr:hypothetical protein [Nocardioides sp. DJM-14]
MPELLEELLGLGSWLSPSAMLMKGIDWVFGFNPGEEAARWVAGDWRRLSVASSALGQIAEYAHAVGAAIHRVTGDVTATWHGNAAQSARVYFEGLSVTLEGMRQPLTGAAREFQQVAFGMHQMTQALAGILESLMDRLISIGIKALAATATAKTIIGGIGFGSWAAYDVWKATQIWRDAIQAHDAALALTQGITGLTAGFLAALESANLALPAEGYDHPGV